MSIAGKWRVSMDTPIGKQQFTWELQQVGADWEGMMHSSMGTAELGAIRVSGQQVWFEATVHSPMGSVHLAFAGSAASDRIDGTCKSRFGNHPFSGERA
jgi:hypothetical protein